VNSRASDDYNIFRSNVSQELDALQFLLLYFNLFIFIIPGE